MKKNRWLQRLLIREEKLREAMELYPGKTREEVRELLFRELKRRLVPGGIGAVVFLVLAWCSGDETAQDGIARPSPGEAALTVQVQLAGEDDIHSVPLSVGALEYEESRIEELHRAAEDYLEQVVPGENESLERITEDLYFPEALRGMCNGIYWSTDAPWLVTAEGEVLNSELTEPVKVQITAELAYGTEYRYFSRVITVLAPEYTPEETVLREAEKELAKLEESTRTTGQFILPEQVHGYRVEQEAGAQFGLSGFLVLLAVILPLLLYSGYFSGLDTRRKERKEQAENGYTEFVTKLSLLLAAGVSVRKALERLAEEYENNHGPRHVLAAELKVTRQELDNGGSETVVYEEFGRRIGVLAYRRMTSLLTQNVSRGVQGMRTLLLQEAKEVMAQDRANIRIKGEQAGTKLLLPMMGLLFLVFAILLVPAFQSF